MHMPSVLAQVLRDVLEALIVLLSKTGKRSAVRFEALKPYWKSDKKLDSIRCSANLSTESFSKS